ncbi:hypothetical protein D3C77_343950 [compost metagenome]
MYTVLPAIAFSTIVNASDATFDADGTYTYRSYNPPMDLMLIVAGNNAHLRKESPSGVEEVDFSVQYPAGKKYLYLHDDKGQPVMSFAEAKPRAHGMVGSGWGKLPNTIGHGVWSKGVVVGQAEDCCGESGPKPGQYEATGFNLDGFWLSVGKEGNGLVSWNDKDRGKSVHFKGRREGSKLIWTEIYFVNDVRKYGQTFEFDGSDPQKLVCIDCSIRGRKLPQTWVFQNSFDK